ncbi:MAG: STT3 domain-containing protein [Promethearchaeota archaeon]
MALVLIVILAIMIRLTPLLRGPTLIKAFDPWIQYYNAKYLAENGVYEYFHWHDEKSWYPEGMDRSSLRPGLTFTVVIIYWILRFLGIPVTLYEVCFYFPAFMGGLTVLAAYFLGKEILDRNCGLFTAFFLALNTGHMMRTMAGFFDNETIGVFATLMTFLFFLKTIHTGKFTYSIIGGIFLGYLSLSWGGFQYVFLILPLVVLISVLLKKYNENILIAYAGVQGTGLLIFALYIEFNHNKFFTDLSLGGVFLFTFVLLLFHLIYIKRHSAPRFYNGLLNFIRWALIPTVIVVAIIIWIEPELIPLGLGKRLTSVLSPLLRDKLHIVASVAEHSPSAWSIFYWNTLIPLLLLPLGIFFCFKRLNTADILLMVFLLTLFYLTGSMIRIILLFAPAACLMGAYGLVNILKIYGTFIGERRLSVSRKRKRQLKRIVGNSEVFAVYALIGFLCVAQVFHAADLSINQLSYSQIVTAGEYHDWEETLIWMQNNLQGTDVVVSWWDYGYWLTPIGNVTTVNDNATHDSKKIGLTGMAFMQTNEIYSAKILRELEADYVLVYFGFLVPGLGGDEGKWPWMLRICNDHYEEYKDDGLEEDNWKSDSVFDEDEYVNESNGLYRDKWFDSQLVRLMFGYEPTDPSDVSATNDYLRWYYASQVSGNSAYGIDAREDDDDNDWIEHIPEDGEYDFKVFRKEYFSRNGLVKIYKVDYTALDSSFSVSDAKVFDNGYATFQLTNEGTRDLRIKSVKINTEAYSFVMGGANTVLEKGSKDVVWVDVTKDYKVNDAVNITVTAEADALDDEIYTFSEGTDYFFVTEAEPGSVKINRENCKVESSDEGTEILLEVQNTGATIENLDTFYVNTEENKFIDTEYLSGSSVLKPGRKATVKLLNADALGEFYFPVDGLKGNLIGVKTSNGVKDESIFSFNTYLSKLSILSENRVVSPELLAATSNSTYRNHIPIDLSDTGTHIYDNGTINIKVKNYGETILNVNNIYVAKADDVRYGNVFNLTTAYIKGDKNKYPQLDPDEETTVNIDIPDLDIDINDEIVVGITASFGGATATSDIGLLHAIRDEKDIQIVERIDSLTTSYIMADESGVLLVKNTGVEEITIQNIKINDTDPINLEYVYGSANLNTQKCALISFDTQGLKINKSNDVFVNITTTDIAEVINYRFIARENPPGVSDYYDIQIDMDGADRSKAINGGDLRLKIDNNGETIVTIDSVYINDTFVDINEFTGSPYQIAIDGSKVITLVNFEEYAFNVLTGDKIKILVRTNEGAEDEEVITVVSS